MKKRVKHNYDKLLDDGFIVKVTSDTPGVERDVGYCTEYRDPDDRDRYNMVHVVTNYILGDHEQRMFFLKNIQNMYVMFSCLGAEHFAKGLTWKEFLPTSMYEYMISQPLPRYFPLSFILISPNPNYPEGSYGIHWVESLVGDDCGMERITVDAMNHGKGIGVPFDISQNRSFWIPYLQKMFDDETSFWEFCKAQKIPTDALKGYDVRIWEEDSMSSESWSK